LKGPKVNREIQPYADYNLGLGDTRFRKENTVGPEERGRGNAGLDDLWSLLMSHDMQSKTSSSKLSKRKKKEKENVFQVRKKSNITNNSMM